MWKIILLMVMVVVLTACEEGQTSIQMINTGSGSASNVTDGNNYTTAFGIFGGSTKNWSLNRSGMPELSGSFVDLQGSGSGGVVNQSFECSGGANEYFYNATWTDGIVNYTCAADTDTDDQTLNEIGNPTGDTTFNMNMRNIEFDFTTGTFTIDAIGAFTNDLLHIHQHTGNPMAGTDLLHLEAEDTDVVLINATGARDTVAYFIGNISVDNSKVCTAANGLCASGSDTNDTTRVNALYAENGTIWSNLTSKVDKASIIQTSGPLFINGVGTTTATIDGGFNLSMTQVNTTTGGFLTATDYVYFSGKLNLSNFQTQNTSTWEAINGKGISNYTNINYDKLSSVQNLSDANSENRGYQCYYDEHFTTSTNSNWMGGANASGSAGSGLSVGDLNHPGAVAHYNTATVGSGYGYSTETSAIQLNGSETTQMIFKVVTPPGVNYTVIQAGYLDTGTTNAFRYNVVDGVYMECRINGTASANSNWCLAKVRNNNAEVNNSIKTSLNFTTWYHLNITIYRPTSATSLWANFTLYNESGFIFWNVNISQNIPTITGRETGNAFISWRQTAGTANTAITLLDYQEMCWKRRLNR